MKKANVVTGETYSAKVSGNRVNVLILSTSRHGGWVGRNLATGREVRIKTAARLHPLSSYREEQEEIYRYGETRSIN